MAKRVPQTRGPAVSTKIPIFTLSGGVSRQAQTKRLPSEVQNMDNALLSLERSIEKRPGFETVVQYKASNIWDNNPATSIPDANRLDLYPLEHLTSTLKDYWFYWFNINDSNRFLVVVNYKATGTTDILIYVFRIRQDGTWSDETQYSNLNKTEQDSSIIDIATRAYITYGQSSNKAKDVLKATTVGNSIIILNTLVKAGFTSGEVGWNGSNTGGFLFDLGGTESSVEDLFGQAITYYSAARYFKGSNSKWYATSQGGTTITLTGTMSVGSTLTLSTLPTIGTVSPAEVAYVSATATPVTISSQNKFLFTTHINANYSRSGTTVTITTSNSHNYKKGQKVYMAGFTNSIAPANNYYVIKSITSATTFTITVSNTVTADSGTVNLTAYLIASGLTVVGTSPSYANSTVTIEYLSGPWVTGTSALGYLGTYQEVEDFIWHDTTQPWFGQSLADFSEIRFPPEVAERNGNNGILSSTSLYSNILFDRTAMDSLAVLYPNDGNTNGYGKIYYTAAPYLNFTSGYFRVISSASKPYTKKVRSTDCYSIVDKLRMPQKITFNAAAAGTTSDPKWFAKPIEWEPRTSGNRYSNPGPSVFLTDDKKKPRQVQIKAVSTFRDRLYFAAEDVIFTSQLGVYEDLFLADPSNIVSTDPIDIRASSNTFSEIVSMTPFNAYLFINTLGNVQYELKGSQNQITPLTAEISPTAFYSTAKFVEPQLMGSLIYFFDKSKLYLYLSSESTDLAIAQELTVTCADYLPNNYRGVCVAPAQNYIAVTDDDNPNYTYMHVSRFSGDKNLQNALFRYVFNSEDAVMANQSYDDYLYSIFRRSSTGYTGTGYFDSDPATQDNLTNNSANTKYRYFLEKSYLRNQTTSQPRLDRLFKMRLYDNNSDYDPTTRQTTIRLPISFKHTDISNIQIITDSSWSNDPEGDRSGEIVSPVAYTITNNYMEILVNGRYVPAVLNQTSLSVNYADATQNPKYLWVGLKYKMEVELSTQFVRDQNNNVIDGVLNLRTVTTRHKRTGNYDIVVSNRGRTSSVSTFTNQKTDNSLDPLSIANYEEEGEFVANILGFSDNVNIKIVSEYPSPCNIVNLEFKGKFIQKYSAIN
jgi:hypothetical protein